MEVFVPVSAVVTPEPPQNTTDAGVGTAGTDLTALTDFLQDHFVRGGYAGGKMMLDLIGTIQGSADTSKSELLRNLPAIARHLKQMPGAMGALFSEDPRKICEVERQFGELSRDLAAATSTGVLFGLSRLVGTVMPFTVAAGAVLGVAVGGERLQLLLRMARDATKED